MFGHHIGPVWWQLDECGRGSKLAQGVVVAPVLARVHQIHACKFILGP